eukprot:3599916-Amphidinium_carterae.1
MNKVLSCTHGCNSLHVQLQGALHGTERLGDTGCGAYETDHCESLGSSKPEKLVMCARCIRSRPDLW